MMTQEASMYRLTLSVFVVAAALTAQAQLRIPSALAEEHEEIHAALSRAERVGGQTGVAAKAVAKVLHPHFEREQQIALPPLGVLQNVANGKQDPNLSRAVNLSRQLARELPAMLAEHRKIGAALQRLERVATREHRPEQAELARRILQHAKTEEQVTYPAAILIAKLKV